MKRGLLDRSIGLSLAAIVASVFGVALNLGMPFLLPAAEYSVFSLLFSVALLASSLAFEWARIGVLRYACTADEAADARRLRVLAAGYGLVAAFMLAAGLGSFGLYAAGVLSWPLHLVFLFAAIHGLFEGQQALDRARADNRLFAVRAILRAALTFAAGLSCAFWFSSGSAALLGMMAGYPVAALIGARRFGRRGTGAPHFGRDDVLFLLRFGSLASLGTNLSLAVPALVRGVLVGGLGTQQAAGLLLVIDLGQRLFATLGSTLNVVFVQSAIRAMEFGDVRAQRVAVRDQALALASLSLGVLITFLAVAPAATGLVPEGYREAFASGASLALVASFLLAVRQYSFDPLFVVFGRPIGSPVGSVATLLCLVLAKAFLSTGAQTGVESVLLALVLSGLVGFVVTIGALFGLTELRLPARDVAGLAGAALIALALLFAMPATFDPVAAAGAGILVLAVFAASVCAFDVLDLRRRMRALHRARPR